MDVNNIGQNSVNLNAYSSNVSEYTKNNNSVAVSHVEQTRQAQTQGEEGNDTEKEGYSKKELDNALKKINNFMKDEHTHAEYSIHKDFGTIMIKIVDEDTNEVILEVPPKKILDMVASMCKQFGLFDRKA